MTISHVIYLEFARLIVSQQWVTEVLPTYINISLPSPAISMSSLILLAALCNQSTISQPSKCPSHSSGHKTSLCLLSAVSSFFLHSFTFTFAHMLTEASWPCSPYINVFTTLRQHVVVVTSYLILSFNHLVHELQLLSVDVRTFVFAIGIPGCNVGRWHTMMSRFHLFCLVQCAKVFE